jgi:transposase
MTRMTKISERTIRYNIAQFGEQDSVEHRSGNGRPYKITPESSIAIGQWSRRNNEIKTKEIADKLRVDRNLSVSRWTVLRQLHRMGYKSILPRAMPMLAKEEKERRVQWALQHQDDDWSCTVFSVESRFHLYRNTIRRWPENSKQELKRIPKNRQKIMVWGAISIKGQIAFHSFRRTMDGSYYVQILQEHLIREFGRRERISDEFLEQEVPETIDWLSNSPDVNSIENLWSILERRIEKRWPSNIDELERFLCEEWKQVADSVLSNLIGSIETRCLALLDSKGERINY